MAIIFSTDPPKAGTQMLLQMSLMKKAPEVGYLFSLEEVDVHIGIDLIAYVKQWQGLEWSYDEDRYVRVITSLIKRTAREYVAAIAWNIRVIAHIPVEGLGIQVQEGISERQLYEDADSEIVLKYLTPMVHDINEHKPDAIRIAQAKMEVKDMNDVTPDSFSKSEEKKKTVH